MSKLSRLLSELGAGDSTLSTRRRAQIVLQRLFHGRRQRAVGDTWDRYVQNALGYAPDGVPGDEWGAARLWDYRFAELFQPYGVDAWREAVEIGQGSGKYTERVLQASPRVVVHCLDVSREFLSLLRRKHGALCEAGRIQPVLLHGDRADEMLRYCDAQGLRRRLDAVFSIDAMVHVDLQFLIAYLVTASLCLRRGGHLILTLADPTTARGFEKLLRDMRAMYLPGTRKAPQFQWVSGDIVRHVLGALGFAVVRCDAPAPESSTPRDLFVVGRLDDPARADGFERYLAS